MTDADSTDNVPHPLLELAVKALKYFFIGLVAVVVALVGVGFLLPAQVHLQRSIEVAAPPATVYVVLNSFRRFQDWSPWKDDDPGALVVYSGAESGVGAKMAWSGEQGGGSQEIIETQPHSLVRIRLVFDGFEGDGYTASYAIEPVGADASRVTWSFDAQYNGVIGRYFGLLTDAMLGPDYDEGLANLKSLVEGLPDADFSTLDVEAVDVAAQTIVYVSGTTTTDVAAITTAFSVAYSKVLAYMEARGVQRSGPNLAIARKWDEQNKVFEYDAGIPAADAKAGDPGEVKVGTTYAGRALRAVHKGSYTQMAPVYAALYAYAGINGHEQNGNLWEEYMRDPSTGGEAELLTHIYMPIK